MAAGTEQNPAGSRAAGTTTADPTTRTDRSGESIPPQKDVAGAPEGPLELGTTAWKQTLRRTMKKIVRDRVSMSAGSLAYHWFLALFPAIVALLGLLAVVHISSGTLQHIVHGVDKALPAGTGAVFTAAVSSATKKSSGSSVAVVVGIVVALWSASGGVSALEQALDIAYEVPVDRKFLARRIRALPIMLAIVVLGGLSAALLVFGASIGSSIEGHVGLHGTAFLVLWTVVRWVVTLVIVTLLFSVLYSLGPNREDPNWRWVTGGGLVATAIFVVASVGFSLYVSKFGTYGRTYGSFAGVAILILWLYFIGLAVLVGGELNAELEREAVAQAGHPGARVSAENVTSQTARR
ncbi:MAG: putative ribonuclease [Acidimicrobiaceae bacterium]|nr:putative ribonuclease [Acidimicrobiaceae bacterium]